MNFLRRAATGWAPFVAIISGIAFSIAGAAGVGRWCVLAAVVSWSAAIVLPIIAWNTEGGDR